MKVARVNTPRFPTLTGPGGLGGANQYTSPAATLPWYDVVTQGGAVGDGITDDTVAIQDSIDTATSSGTCSAVIYFPPGIYLIGGALQDTGAFNAQLLLPNVGHTDPHIVIEFRGAVRPGLHPVYGTTWDDGCFSVIKSSLTGASGTAAVISGGNNLAAPSSGGGNNLEVFISDLVCVGVDNPTFTFWNLSACQGGGCDALQISTPGGFAGSAVEPTHTNAYGIKLPAKYFSSYTECTGLSVGGFYTCVLNGELAMHHGLLLGICIVGVEMPETFYPSVIFDMTMTAFQYGIRMSGVARMDVLSYTAEHQTSPPWTVTIYDLDDPSDEHYGYIRWFNAASGGTPDHTFTVNGGANSGNQEVSSAWGTGTSATTMWVPVMVQDGATGLWYVTVTGDGDAVMTEVPL
jgi:hypothetical protein